MKLPDLPRHLEVNEMEQKELVDLWNCIVREIIEPAYQGRTHGNRRTYDAGCKGPMCAKGVREHGRRRATDPRPKGKYVFIDPIIDYWRPIAEGMIMKAFDEIEEQLTAPSTTGIELQSEWQ